MSQVFDANTLLATRAHSAPDDSKPPMLGKLMLKSMTSPTALQGTTGTDCTLVHGDVWRQLEGNEGVNILKNLTTDIKLNETREVHTDLINRVDGTTTDTRVGAHHQTHVASRFEEFFHTVHEVHHEKVDVYQPTVTLTFVQQYMKFNPIYFATTLMDFSAKGTKVELVAVEGTAKGAVVEYKAAQVKHTSIEFKFSEFAVDFTAVRAYLSGLVTKAAPVEAKANAVEANAGVAVNADSPLA